MIFVSALTYSALKLFVFIQWSIWMLGGENLAMSLIYSIVQKGIMKTQNKSMETTVSPGAAKKYLLFF